MREEKSLQKLKLGLLVLCAVSMIFAMAEEAKAVDVYTDDFIYVLDVENQTAKVYEYENKGYATCTEVIIPSKITYEQKEYTVTSIASSAMSYSEYTERIEIPDTVTEIGEQAFYGCERLKYVRLPVGIKEIKISTFADCTSLEEIVIPNTVEIIRAQAFLGCSKLKKIEIPDSVTEIEYNCFLQCVELEEIVFSNSVKKIGTKSFSGCTGLTQVVIPENVEEVVASSFYDCDNLESIFYPSNVKDVFLDDEYRNVVRVSYVVNADGTVSLAVENLPEGATDIDLPSDIGGRRIVSITGPPGVNIPVSCTKHYTKEYKEDASGHWYTCKVCKEEVKEVHSYEKGSQPCVCGYKPFMIAAQPTSLQLAYAHKEASLSVTSKATFGTEKVTYQWYEDGKTIAGATGASYKIPKDKPVGSYTYTCKLTSGGYSQVTQIATVTIKAPVKGSKYKDDKNMATYKVTKARIDGKGTAEYVKPVSKKKATVIIPATVEIGGVTYKVTAIAKNAFKNNRYLKRLTIEKNVEKIGAKAFYGCKKLKNITIKTAKLTTKKVGSKAFKGIKSNVTIKVPKKKFKAYKSMLLKKGVGKKAKIRKL